MPNVTVEKENNFSFCLSFSRWGRKIILSPQYGLTKQTLRRQSSLACDNHSLRCLTTEISRICCTSVVQMLSSFFPTYHSFPEQEKSDFKSLLSVQRKFQEQLLISLFPKQCSASYHPSCRMISCKALVSDIPKISWVLGCIYNYKHIESEGTFPTSLYFRILLWFGKISMSISLLHLSEFFIIRK